MNHYKKGILNHYVTSIEFVESLKTLEERIWRTPINEGKWTIAEIVGHFKPWDEFVIKNRIPYFFSSKELPRGPDTDTTNAQSAKISREETKQDTIHKFISTRKALYEAVENIPVEYWEKKIAIGKTVISLHEYFNGLIKHDHHHFEQIKNTLQLLHKN